MVALACETLSHTSGLWTRLTDVVHGTTPDAPSSGGASRGPVTPGKTTTALGHLSFRSGSARSDVEHAEELDSALELAGAFLANCYDDYGQRTGEVDLPLCRRVQSTNSPDLLAKGRSEILQDLWAGETGIDSAEDDLNRSGGR